MTSLELAVENLQATCASLLKDLNAVNSKITDLNVVLQAECDYSKHVYQCLRTECHAQQCSDKWKEVLAGTIAVLRETTEAQLQKQKELEKSVALTGSEIKQVELSNSKLWAELLSNVQLFAKDLALSRELLSSSQAALRGTTSEVYNLSVKIFMCCKKAGKCCSVGSDYGCKKEDNILSFEKGCILLGSLQSCPHSYKCWLLSRTYHGYH